MSSSGKKYQISNAITLQELANFCSLMLRIHGPKRVNGPSSCHHQPLCTPRVHLQEVCDIIDAALITHPDLLLGAVMLSNILLAVGGRFLLHQQFLHQTPATPPGRASVASKHAQQGSRYMLAGSNVTGCRNGDTHLLALGQKWQGQNPCSKGQRRTSSLPLMNEHERLIFLFQNTRSRAQARKGRTRNTSLSCCRTQAHAQSEKGQQHHTRARLLFQLQL